MRRWSFTFLVLAVQLGSPNAAPAQNTSGIPVQTGSNWFVGTASGFVTPPSAAPILAVDSTSAGNFPEETTYCVITYQNRDGETPPSPQARVRTTGSTNVISAVPGDYNWLTGAAWYNVYCGTASGGPYYAQTPAKVSVAIANNGFTRSAGGVVTVTTSTREPFTKWQNITIGGASGCRTSPNGTQQVAATNFNPATSFTFNQAGTTEICGGSSATASYPTYAYTNANGVNGHDVVDSSGAAYNGVALISAYAASGVNPPSTNRAKIDPIQVAYNSARFTSSVTGKKGSLVLSDTSDYALTTELITGYDGPRIMGDHGPIDVSQAGTATGAGPRITCSWSGTLTGCVRVVGRGQTFQGLSIIASGVTNALMAGWGSPDMNSLTLDGVYLQTYSGNVGVGAFRAYHVKEAHQWRFKDVTMNGGQFDLYASNSVIGDLSFSMGRLNCGGSGEAITNAAGPGDTDHGTSFIGYKSVLSLQTEYVDTESCSSQQGTVDFGGGYLILGTGWSNSDGAHPSGTVAVYNFWDDNYSWGGATGGVKVSAGAALFGSNNAGATMKINAPFGSYVDGILDEGDYWNGSASNAGLDLSNQCIPLLVESGPLNGSGLVPDPNATSASGALIINVPTGCTGISSINAAGQTNTSGTIFPYTQFGHRIALLGSSGAMRCLDFNFNSTADTFNFLGGRNCGTTHWTDDTNGNVSVLGTLGFKGLAGSRGATFTGNFSGARTFSWPDASGTVSLVLVATSGSLGGRALTAGSCSSATVPIPGATSDMVTTASPSSDPGSGFYWLAFVSSPNTVIVRICAAVAGTPAATTYNVRVIQ